MDIKTSHSLSQQIEFFLDGNLEGDDLEKFEKLLSSDPEFAYEVERVRIARTMIKNEALREKLTVIQSEEIVKNRFNTHPKDLLKYFYLGVIALLFLVSVFKIFSINNDTLYTENYRHYYLNPVKTETIENSLLYNFSKSNFHDVINIYENTPGNSNENHFFAGVSYLEINLTDSAIQTLVKILTNANKGDDHSFLPDTEYYLGFSYLKANKLDYAYWYFSKIYHDMDHPYHERVSSWFYFRLKITQFRKKIF